MIRVDVSFQLNSLSAHFLIMEMRTHSGASVYVEECSDQLKLCSFWGLQEACRLTTMTRLCGQVEPKECLVSRPAKQMHKGSSTNSQKYPDNC